MAQRIELFSKGALSLSVLTADIEFLLSAIETTEESVRHQLQEHWAALEEVYSVALAMHAGRLDAKSESLIQKTVTELRALVAALGGAPEEPGRLG